MSRQLRSTTQSATAHGGSDVRMRLIHHMRLIEFACYCSLNFQVCWVRWCLEVRLRCSRVSVYGGLSCCVLRPVCAVGNCYKRCCSGWRCAIHSLLLPLTNYLLTLCGS